MNVFENEMKESRCNEDNGMNGMGMGKLWLEMVKLLNMNERGTKDGTCKNINFGMGTLWIRLRW